MRLIAALLSIALCGLGAVLESAVEVSAAMQAPKRIYLAGPLGFSEAGRAFKIELMKRLTNLGYDVLDPFELTPSSEIEAVERLPTLDQKREAWRKLNTVIGRTNQQAIDRVDIVLAILDGQDVDSGTAAEIGYAYARGKPILGYRGDFRIAADNIGATVNLQVEYFINASGGRIVQSVEAIPEALARMLAVK
jgi:nucleoside 2-deoxyribosyltransferase